MYLGLPKRKAVTNANDDGAIVSVTREQELWAMALWVDREHGEDGERFITERVLHFDAIGDEGGKLLWMVGPTLEQRGTRRGTPRGPAARTRRVKNVAKTRACA